MASLRASIRATPTKRHARRRTAWCCIRRATTTRSSFTTCTGFIRTISEEVGKRRPFGGRPLLSQKLS